jgi:hypothetical protein
MFHTWVISFQAFKCCLKISYRVQNFVVRIENIYINWSQILSHYCAHRCAWYHMYFINLCFLLNYRKTDKSLFHSRQVQMAFVFSKTSRFWGALAKLGKTTVGFVTSACPSVSLSTWNNPAPIGRILWDLIFKHFVTICRENSSFIKVWQECRVLYMKINIVYDNICSVILIMRNASDKSCTENQNDYFMFNKSFFPKIVAFLR